LPIAIPAIEAKRRGINGLSIAYNQYNVILKGAMPLCNTKGKDPSEGSEAPPCGRGALSIFTGMVLIYRYSKRL